MVSGVGVNDPKLSGLYGRAYDLETPEAGSWLAKGRIERPKHQAGNPVFESFREEGYNKFIEVIDKYQPDQLQTDGFTCVRLGQDRLKKILAHHFNTAGKSGREVVVSRGYDSHHPYTPSGSVGFSRVHISYACHQVAAFTTQMLPCHVAYRATPITA